jgi:hypothetical protein
MEGWLRLRKLGIVARAAFQVIGMTKAHREWQLRIAVVVTKLLYRGKKQLERRGGYEAVIRRRLRSAFTMTSLFMGPELSIQIYAPDRTSIVTGEVTKGKLEYILPGGAVVERAKKALFWFLTTSRRCRQVKSKVHLVYKYVNFISERFRNRNAFISGKGAMLHILWE